MYSELYSRQGPMASFSEHDYDRQSINFFFLGTPYTEELVNYCWGNLIFICPQALYCLKINLRITLKEFNSLTNSFKTSYRLFI
jgi:hypothetical protein